MITTNDILTQWQTFKDRFNEFKTLITGEVDADATLDDLTSVSKTAEYEKWMDVGAGICVIMDGSWEDRKQEISDKVDSGLPGTDRWLQRELFKFQYGDALLWNEKGFYYYAVIDATKQIITRCAIISSGGITKVKVATTDGGGNVIPLSAPQLTAFDNFVTKQIQWSGAKIDHPTSFNSDKLDAPMTVYYNAIRKLEDIKAIVEPAWNEFISNVDVFPFNAEYSINKHGDFVEDKSSDIKEVTMGVVRARSDAGAFIAVARVYTPVSGYLVRDPAISFDTMITYVPV